MDRVRMGIIGLGVQGSYHVALFKEGKIKRAEVTAVCDIVPEKLAPYGDYKTFTNSAAMIRSGVVDAVLIATPHYDHTTIGIDALQNGLHVLVEKPISVHKADCERSIAAHTDPKVVFAAMFNQRTDPQYIKIKQLIDGGRAGRDPPRPLDRSPTGSAPRPTTPRAAGAPPGRARAAACCSTSARTTSTCCSGSAACRSRCAPSAASASTTTSRSRTT